MICPITHAVVKRGLCFTCYKNDSIRPLYPFKASKHNSRGLDVNGNAKLPDKPTEALAGSIQKMMVMQYRLERGEQLHHPLDNKHQHMGPSPFIGLSWRTGQPTGLEMPCSDSSKGS